MVSPLFSGFQFAAVAAVPFQVGALVVFVPEYRDYATGCRIVEILADGSLVLRVLDLGPDHGMKFVAEADQIRPAL